MGTVVTFDVRPGELAHGAVYLALAEARRLLHRADAVFSTWKAQSPVSRLRRGEVSLAEVPEEVRAVLDLCRQARTLSGGWFDPWAMPGGVDPAGLVKGWAAAAALSVLREAGVAAAMVNAGGDIAVMGRPDGPGGRPWRVAIRDPWDPMRLIARAGVTGAIATSGTYERGDHVIDPSTGAPTTDVVSATVTGPDLALADALATALVAGGEEAVQAASAVPGYEALVIRSDQSATATAGFPFLT